MKVTSGLSAIKLLHARILLQKAKFIITIYAAAGGGMETCVKVTSGLTAIKLLHARILPQKAKFIITIYAAAGGGMEIIH